MAEFLLELFSEEIPAGMQARAAAELQRLVTDGLTAAGLAFTHAEAHVTPRRLALVVDGLPVAQPLQEEERKGPRGDAPQPAIDGFLRSVGLTLDQCELRETPKGAVWFAVVKRPGRPTAAVLSELIGTVLTGLAWPKSMRIGETGLRWVRPLHHVLAVFDGMVMEGGVEPVPGARFAFVDHTSGHRFLAPAAFPVTGFADYQAGLRERYAILDREERKRLIAARAGELAAAEGLHLRDDPGLLDEVAGLVEWPVPLLGRIDDAFMDVPPEVLTTAMRTHQRYFACLDAQGRLAARFVVVANMVTTDGGQAVVEGNQRVLRARLSDARFFWDQDRRTRLDQRLPALADIIFHAKLGSMAEKAARIERLAGRLAASIPGAEPELAARAARLAKADLVTGMVGEFPELQGVMGRYYAAADGEDEVVAEAIGRHYAPLGPDDACPILPVAVAVALADKLDTLAGFFAIGEKPTGSRDPFGLRRAALGVIRLIIENQIRLPLRQAFAAAWHRGAPDPAVIDELLGFFADRLKVALRERGVRHDLIAAVFALGDEDDLVRLLARVDALGRFLGSREGADLLVAYRRAANITRIEAKKDGRDDWDKADPERRQHEEAALSATLVRVRQELGPALAREDFAGAMSLLASLRNPVDAFFDRVTVNAPEPNLRANRLALLMTIVRTMNRVADFARIEG